MSTSNGYFYVSECPLSAISLCHWRSEPMTSESAAVEALRAHVGGAGSGAHTHADLVQFAASHMITITKYHPQPPS